MAYSLEIASLLAAQLKRFVTLNRYQLVGHVPNLDFWLVEVKHCLDVIDGYDARFDSLYAAQKHYVEQHNTVEFSLSDPCCTREGATLPKRVPKPELTESRRALCDAAYRFLIRCYRDELISEDLLRDKCADLDIEVNYSDLN